MGIRAFSRPMRAPIYAIYGYVRFADEIVDTFHGFPRQELLERFRADTWRAIDEGISLNPVLQAFQETVNRYRIDCQLIAAFLDSMAMDLAQDRHGRESFDAYIFGSAEVVGLMCLRVFVEGDDRQYEALKEPARRLGAAFQKVNFLRDMRSDFEERGRVYFPDLEAFALDEEIKVRIEEEVDADFMAAKAGIRGLPEGARFGVWLAYRFYYKLFARIRRSSPEHIRQNRIRVPNWNKFLLIGHTWVQARLRLI